MKILRKYFSAVLLPIALLCIFGLQSYAQTRYDWTGNSSTVWTNVNNWTSTTGGVTTSPATSYPQLATDTADFGVNVNYSTKSVPTLTGTISIATVNMGDNLATQTSYAVYNYYTTCFLIINGTLNVATFTQKHSKAGLVDAADQTNAGNGYTNAIQNYVYTTVTTGTGVLNISGNFNMGDGTVPTNSHVVNTTRLKIGAAGTSAGKLLTINLTGNLNIYSPASKTAGNQINSVSDAEFSLAGGILNLSGQIIETNVATPYTFPTPDANLQYLPLDFFSIDLFKNADSPVLNLYNANAVSINESGINQNVVDFYNIVTAGGTGTATVNYAGTGNQEVYVYNTTGMDKNIDHGSAGSPPDGRVYQNIIFSGGGTKTVDAGTFNLAGNITLASGSTCTVDLTANNPTPTLSGNFFSYLGTTFNNGSVALTIAGTTTNGGTFNNANGSNVTFTGALTNSGLFNQTGSGTVTASSTTSNSGTYNQSGTGLATFTGAMTNTGTINQTSTGGLTFSAAFTNSGPGSLLNQTGSGPIILSSSLTNQGGFTQGSGTVTVAGAVNNSGNLTLGSVNFSMASDFTNSGNFTAGTGTAIFNSSGTVHLNDSSAGGTTFNNVNFTSGKNAVMQSGIFAVSSIGIMTLSNSGTQVTSGGGNLTFNSDASGSATLAALPAGCQVNGTNVTVQRFVAGGFVNGFTTRGYRLVSPSVWNATDSHNNNVYTISYLLNSTYISGTAFVPTTSNPNSKTGAPSLYLFRENLVPQYTTFLNSNYRGIESLAFEPQYAINTDSDPGNSPLYDIPVGNGYLFFFRGGETTTNPFTTTSIPDDGTLAATGSLNQGNISVTNWYNESLGNTGLLYTNTDPDPTIQGMNLVGNPYPSTIDWNTWSATNPNAGIYGPGTTGVIYLLNPGGQAGQGNYDAYIANVGGSGNATNLIASGVGFFAQANTANGQLTFTENAKVNTQVSGSALYMANKRTLAAVKQQIRLQMLLDSVNTDDVLINFNPNTKTAFNMMEDARYKLGSGKVSLASLSSDNVALTIDQLPLAQKGDTIGLQVGATANGTYTLKLKSITGIPQLYDIWLKDALNKDSVNLRTTSTYSFTLTTTDSTTFAGRFKLVLQQDPALAYQLLSFDADKTANGRQVQLTWKTKNEEDYTRFTVERSNDGGKNFSVIGSMISNGQGEYDLPDRNPGRGSNLYRLKQEDFNDNITYSNTVNVNFGNGGIARLNCFPNPAINNIFLSFDPKSQGKTTYNIRITNSTGMVVRFAEVTDTSWQDNVSNLLTGTYLIQVTDKKDNSVVGQTKFVKL